MKPVIALVCDLQSQGPHLYHQTGDKYIQAIRRCCHATPVLVPSIMTDRITAEEIMSFADGMLFTGGYSNIERHHYGLAPAPEDENQDKARDDTTLSLLPELLKAGFPVLGICRGLQEMNVSLGGTLYPRLHEVEGRFDHREDKNAPLDVQYGPAHPISVKKGGHLHHITGEESFMVNTVHGQGINQIPDTLEIEAMADDGTIEAVSVKDTPSFALAVQWHPEWKAWDNPQSVKIFSAFEKASRTFMETKQQKKDSMPSNGY